MGKFDIAMTICFDAAKRGLLDGTKCGFKGRLIRLEREAARRS
jgi:hypothetical protein